jgi:pimeloyl-ACP methyl ester carboxylesterase
MQQQIQYCTTPDGIRLAYSVIGKGTPIVRASHWFNNLEYDLKSPVYRHIILGLAHRHSLLRYDARGNGLSQREVAEISFDLWISDLETVVDRAGLDRFTLIGISQGASIAIAYAVKHPDRISHLIIYGGYARGLLHRGNPEKQEHELDLARTLIREGWGSDQETYRQFFTSQIIPDGTAEQYRSLNEMERVSATPELAERLLCEFAKVNVTDLLPKVTVPTLVLHVRGDLRAPFADGQQIAASIPGAKFVPLEGRNHFILPNDRAHRGFFDAISSFLDDRPMRGSLPGTANLWERLEQRMRNLEQNWFIKFVIILAAITGVAIFFLEVWRILHH